MNRLTPAFLVLLFTAGCASSDPFSPRHTGEPISRIELMRSSVAPYRVFTLQEIQAIPDGTTTDELFAVFGRGIEGRSEVTPFIILAREGHANSEEDRAKYGFYVWPSSFVKEYTDRIKIEYISYDPEGNGQQIIIWPSSMRGMPLPKDIPALKSQTTEPNQSLETTSTAVTDAASQPPRQLLRCLI